MFRHISAKINIKSQEGSDGPERFKYSFFVKVPRPGNSKDTFSVFESGCHLLLPV